jgi:signal peptidase I
MNFENINTKSVKASIKDTVRTLIIILPIAFTIRTFGYGLYTVPTPSMEPTMLVGERFFANKFSYLFSDPQRGDIITCNDPTYKYSDNKIMRLFQKYVYGPQNWTKRIIAVPGDHVQGGIEDGKPVISVNGKKLEESYINPYPIFATVDEADQSLTYRTYDPNVAFDKQPFYKFDPSSVAQAQKALTYYGQVAIKYPYNPVESNNRIVDEFDMVLKNDQYFALGDNRQGSRDSRFWGILDRSLIHGRVAYRLISIDTQKAWLLLDILTNPIDFCKRIRWNRFFQKVV